MPPTPERESSPAGYAFPNAVNVPQWRNQVLLEPGQTYRHVQIFQFG